jgi:flagellar protein FliS
LNPYASAQQAYTESSVLTAPPEKLVVMLYDGAIRFLNVGAIAMRGGDFAQARDRIRRAEAILDELNYSLDMSQGEIAVRLRSIYIFSKKHLLEATLQRNPEAIDAVVKLLGELRDAWERIAGQPLQSAA